MVLVNEMMRPTIKENPYSKGKTIAMNSAIQSKDKCSWVCHNNTSYCKTNHVKYLKPYFENVDLLYFGMIGGLKGTGNYVWANIIFLVLLLPLLMYYLLIRILDMRNEIITIKKRNG